MIWKHLNQPDAQELVAWTNAKLDHEPTIVSSFIFWPWVGGSDRELIMHAGEPPLPAKRGRPRDDKVWEAARDVKLIRQIWKQHKKLLDGKFMRLHFHPNDTIEVTAEQIAANRWGVEVEAVRNRLHKKPS